MAQELTSNHIVKHFAGVIALSDGCLTANGGEVVALMGANGSGKSTLCKIITGVVGGGGGGGRGGLGNKKSLKPIRGV